MRDGPHCQQRTRNMNIAFSMESQFLYEMFEAIDELCFHLLEIPFPGLFAADQYMIHSGNPIFGKGFCDKRPKTAFHAIAGYRVADFFGYGDSIAYRVG